jgi:MFS family permease
VTAPRPSALRSFAYVNFRLWFLGSLISSIGTWMQRVAQDWLVLTQLTHHDAAAVGWVTALQFGPQVLLLPWTGYAADHFDRRKLLIATQAAMGVLALALGALVISRTVQVWHVYLLALLQGVVMAFDSPARQTFVADMVGEKDLANALALNSTLNNASRLVSPAAAGAFIATLGTGWAFIGNGISFFGVLFALAAMSRRDLKQVSKTGQGSRLWGRCRLHPQATQTARRLHHAVSDRHLRDQFSDLHFHHGGDNL